MEFTFNCTLKGESLSLWNKTVAYVSTIADHVKVDLFLNRLAVNAINQSKTSMTNVILEREPIFSSFEIMGDFSEFHFLLNSKQLMQLFKNLIIEDVESYKISLISSQSNKFSRLYIEIVMKNKVHKKHSINYTKCTDNLNLDIINIYKEKAQEEGEERVNVLTISESLIKNFLDKFPANLEDFKIQVLSEKRKVNLHGFNKSISSANLKNKDFQALKQSISLTVSVRLEDFVRDNILVDRDYKMTTFRVKDLKSYVHFVSGICGYSFGDCETRQESGYIDMYISEPGFPIIFENEGDNSYKSQLILLTDSEANNNKTVALEREALFVPEEEPEAESLNLRQKTTHQKTTHQRHTSIDENVNDLASHLHNLDDGPAGFSDTEIETNSGISWGNQINHTKEMTFNNPTTKKLKVDPKMLGPTQTEKPKGLFD